MRIWKRSDNGNWYGYGNGHKAVIYSHVDTDEVTVLVYDRFEFLVEKIVKSNLVQAKRYAEKWYLRSR